MTYKSVVELFEDISATLENTPRFFHEKFSKINEQNISEDEIVAWSLPLDITYADPANLTLNKTWNTQILFLKSSETDISQADLVDLWDLTSKMADEFAHAMQWFDEDQNSKIAAAVDDIEISSMEIVNSDNMQISGHMLSGSTLIVQFQLNDSFNYCKEC